MKRIVFLSYYFEPDLSAGSFRNTSLFKELVKQINNNHQIDVYTTLPNRYNSFIMEANTEETNGNVKIYRIPTPAHKSSMITQIVGFAYYFKAVLKMNRKLNCHLVYASSSRLFTAFLGSILSRWKNSFLYLDIRDIFKETIIDTIKIRFLSKTFTFFISLIENYTFSRANHINLISPGFEEYFKKYYNTPLTYFTNGIDEIFLQDRAKSTLKEPKEVFEIVYAGNIGWSQALHKVIPKAAKDLGDRYRFTIIGDGGAKSELSHKIEKLEIQNVQLFNPIKREELKNIYANSDCMLIHLDKKPAFEKVIPSKVFELSTYDKPIVAGVSGFPKTFIDKNLSAIFTFPPCSPSGLLKAILKARKNSSVVDREDFVKAFSRKNINKNMAQSILESLAK